MPRTHQQQHHEDGRNIQAEKNLYMCVNEGRPTDFTSTHTLEKRNEESRHNLVSEYIL